METCRHRRRLSTYDHGDLAGGLHRSLAEKKAMSKLEVAKHISVRTPNIEKHNISVPLTEDGRARLLNGVRNAILLVSPFWIGLIYWLRR